MSLVLKINNVDMSSYLKATSLRITENWQGERDRASFRLEDVPFDLRPLANQPIIIYDTKKNPSLPTVTDREFIGMVINPSSVDIGSGNVLGEEAVSYDVDCGNVADAFYQHLVTDSYVQKYTGFMLRDQIKRQAPQIDVSGIPDGVKKHPFWGVELEPLTRFIDALCATEGWQWYMDGNKIMIGAQAQRMAQFTLTDNNLHKIGGKGVVIAPEDASQIRNLIYFEFMARVQDGLAAVKTGDTVVELWRDSQTTVYNRYTNSPDWSSLTPGGVFYVTGIPPAVNSPGRYSVQGISPYNGNTLLNSAFAEFATEGEVYSTPAPTRDGFRTRAASLEQQTAIDRLAPGDWIRVRTTVGLESRYIKAIVRTQGATPPTSGSPTTYDITFGDGNPTTPGDPSTSAAVPATAAIPLVYDPPTVADLWTKLESYVMTEVPSLVVKEDSDSIQALKTLLANGDTGIRDDRMQGHFVMTFQEAIDRVNAVLEQYANPLVNFKLPTTSWQLRQEGQTARLKAGMGVQCFLTSRGVNGVQTIKQIVRQPAGAYDEFGEVLWKLTLDFSDRLFFLHNVVKRIKEDLQAIGAEKRGIRGVMIVREKMIGHDEVAFPFIAVNETASVLDTVSFPHVSVSENATLTDPTTMRAVLAPETINAMDQTSLPAVPAFEFGQLSDTVTLSGAPVQVSESGQLTDSAAFTLDNDGPFNYGAASYGWSEYTQA